MQGALFYIQGGFMDLSYRIEENGCKAKKCFKACVCHECLYLYFPFPGLCICLDNYHMFGDCSIDKNKNKLRLIK